MFSKTTCSLSLIAICLLLSFCGASATSSLGKCFTGSSNEAASDYPPEINDCDIHPEIPGDGSDPVSTGWVCFMGKVSDLDFYSMRCMSKASCDAELKGVKENTNVLYEEVICCTDTDLCNDYTDPKEDGSEDDDDTSGSTTPLASSVSSSIMMVSMVFLAQFIDFSL